MISTIRITSHVSDPGTVRVSVSVASARGGRLEEREILSAHIDVPPGSSARNAVRAALAELLDAL